MLNVQVLPSFSGVLCVRLAVHNTKRKHDTASFQEHAYVPIAAPDSNAGMKTPDGTLSPKTMHVSNV